MKMVRERILADGGLQYREGVNAVSHMLRAACSSSHAFRSRRRVPDGFRVSCEYDLLSLIHGSILNFLCFSVNFDR